MRRTPRLTGATIAQCVSLVALLFTTTAAACSSGDKAQVGATPAPLVSTRTPTYTYEVVRTYPHDVGAYTEGLLFHDGRLFESTGNRGESNIREVDLQTGRVIRQRDLKGKDNIDSAYFGEGIIITGDNIIQMTWKSEVAFIYDWKTFEPKGQFKYQGEGWALTMNGDSLIMSNGSSVINYRDPKTFAITRSITVTDHDVPVSNINELEWVKGEIYANVFETKQIVRIDPATGKVLGWIDLTDILPAADRTGKEDVLNGIAYDEKNDRLYVTGKYWPKMFEIKLKQRS
ncbi:MAG: glutaminyl-peptide cyclotransferase [Gemmatimonas sp.]